MTRITPKEKSDLTPREQGLLDQAEGLMGFTPNDALTMARVPGLVEASAGLVQAVLAAGRIDPLLKRLAGMAASVAAGCDYCQSHTHYSAQKMGVPPEKVSAILSGLYDQGLTEQEAAVVRVAAASASSSGGVTDDQFQQLQSYFTDDEIAELVAVMALYGFLNRWNKTLMTEIEQEPANCPIIRGG